MPHVVIKIGQKNQHLYNLSKEQIKYLMKFVKSITDDVETENNEESELLKEIETGLKQVKKIRNGELPRRTIKQMIDEK